jgi:hypothetical protein
MFRLRLESSRGPTAIQEDGEMQHPAFLCVLIKELKTNCWS